MDALQVAIARHGYVFAVGQVIRLGNASERALAQAAMDTPNPVTIRELIDAGRLRPWGRSVIEAVAEIGIIASEEVLHAD